MRRCSLLLLGMLCCPAFAVIDERQLGERIGAMIEAEMSARNIAGLSVALVHDQELVWAAGFGHSDIERGTPASADTVYRVGSIAKLFTALALLQLQEAGRLDIDRPLQSYLPGFSMRSRFADAVPMTLRHLMTHHAGIPADYLKGMWSAAPEPFDTVPARLASMHVAAAPNQVFAYSNLGYALLGCVVQQVSDRPFAQHTREALLDRIGMSDSSFSSSPPSLASMSKAYRAGREVVEPALRDVPAGGLNASARDLGRFVAMVFADGRVGERRIVEARTLAEMLRPQNLDVPLDRELRVGLGWMLAGPLSTQGPALGGVAYHYGATINFRAQLMLIPSHKLGVVVLANSAAAGPTVTRVAAEMLRLVVPQVPAVGAVLPAPARLAGHTVGAGSVDAMLGVYATPSGLIKLSRRNGQVQIERLGSRVSEPASLIAGDAGPVRSPEGASGSESRATLIRVGERQVLVTRSGGQEVLLGERIRRPHVPSLWWRRLGSYRVTNANEDFVHFQDVALRERDGLLTLEFAGPEMGVVTYALAAISDRAAVVLGVGRGLGETIEIVERNGGELLWHAGYLFERR